MSAGKKIRKVTGKGIVFSVVAAMLLTVTPLHPAEKVYAAESHLLSLNRTAYASSIEGNNSAQLAVDGNTGSRWSSGWGTDDEWIYLDLGAPAAIDKIKILWEGAYAKGYKVQVSNDEFTWTDIYTTTTGDGGLDELAVTGNGRFVRILGTERAMSAYGISIYEIEVYGTGGVGEAPLQYGPNVALNKPVQASSYEQAGYLPPGATLPSNAVDGNPGTRWGSNHTDDEWFYVDLGNTRTIGRIVLNWEAAGRAFDIQVSDNATSWNTIYRELRGGGGKQDIPVYTSGRYVRMKGIGRASSFGYSLYDFEVYDYVAGHPQPAYSIPALPTPTKVQVGQGSYLTNDIVMPQPRYPVNKAGNVAVPIASNDWWQSLLIKPLGDSIITLPLKSKFFTQGLGILNPGAGKISGDGVSVSSDGNPDLYMMASNINTAKMSNRVTDYGDYSVDTVLSDNDADKMKVTFVKGSPYVFSQFSDPNSVELYSSLVTEIVNGSGATVLAADGATFTGDRIRLKVTNDNDTRYYGIFAPEGTVFRKVGPKIKIQLGGGSHYLSLASLPAAADFDFYYQHAYAFVTDTAVSYNYNESTSLVTTNFNATTELKRAGFSGQTLQALYPHQWKIATTPLTTRTYPSIRGTLKVSEGNAFTTVDRFYGMVPQFTEPTNPEYSRQSMLDYLEMLDQETRTNIMAGDAYWQGKSLHPLAMGVLAANEIGDTTYRDRFLSRIKAILIDWYTYTDGEPDHFLYYNQDWGTMYYKHSEFGANTGITDHHFTYGYYVFASAVLAMYDDQFRTDYGDMVEHLIRDYANPSKTDPLYPSFRSFDPYQGHSWAGGYADNDSGNNQEAAGESLFGWVGQYMWSLLTGDVSFRDASIYGFTTELKAVEQYWFNYDGDNWLPQWTHKSVGQVYGSSYFYGTFFSGEAVHIYGIHWLPTSEYLTSYAFDKSKAAALYDGFVADNGGPEKDWKHIVWPIQALSNPQAVVDKWSPEGMQRNEIFNTYWFVNSMASLGERTQDVWATGWSGATVYKKNGAYSAQIWNTTNSSVTVTFKNAVGTTGTAVVGARSLVQVNPLQNSNVSDPWTPWDGIKGSEPVDGGGNNGGGGNTSSNLALHSEVTVSSFQEPFAGANATDGSLGTRWASAVGADPQWLTVDFGSAKSFNQVKLTWEAAFAKSYKLQLSDNGTDWSDIYSTTTGEGGTDIIAAEGTGRYLRVYGTERGTVHGYSLYEVEVFNNPAAPVNEGPAPLSLNKPVTVSSVQGPFVGSSAVDGDGGTRWASEIGIDPQWIAIDLGQSRSITRIKLEWETAFGKSYKLQVSSDGTVWSDLYSTTTGDGGTDDVTVSGTGRYVRMLGTERGTAFGYSLWNFEVHGS